MAAKQIVLIVFIVLLCIPLVSLLQSTINGPPYVPSEEALQQSNECKRKRAEINRNYKGDYEELQKELLNFDENAALYCCPKYFDGLVDKCVDPIKFFSDDPFECENYMARWEYGDTSQSMCEYPGSACAWNATKLTCNHCTDLDSCRTLCETSGGDACDYLEDGYASALSRQGCEEGEQPAENGFGCEAEGTKCLYNETPPCPPCVYDQVGKCLHWTEAVEARTLDAREESIKQCVLDLVKHGSLERKQLEKLNKGFDMTSWKAEVIQCAAPRDA